MEKLYSKKMLTRKEKEVPSIEGIVQDSENSRYGASGSSCLLLKIDSLPNTTLILVPGTRVDIGEKVVVYSSEFPNNKQDPAYKGLIYIEGLQILTPDGKQAKHKSKSNYNDEFK